MNKLNINPQDYIPEHKYIRLYDTEEEYQQDIDNHTIEECAYSLVNRGNLVEKAEYQPSHRTTNGDNLKMMKYLTEDKINLWAGLKIIWGYFGWEEATITVDGEELLGGNFYTVKPMTTVLSVPDLYQYQHLNNFLKNVGYINTYEPLDLSTIRSCSWLIKSDKYRFVVPKQLTDQLDHIEYANDILFSITKTASFESSEINLNSLKSAPNGIIDWTEYDNSIISTPKFNIGSLTSVDYNNNWFWKYYNIYVQAKTPDEDGIIRVYNLEMFGNTHNINKAYYYFYIYIPRSKVVELHFTENWGAENIVASSNIYISLGGKIYIDIPDVITIDGSATFYANEVFIENLRLKYTARYGNFFNTDDFGDILERNITIKNLEFLGKTFHINLIDNYDKSVEFINLKLPDNFHAIYMKYYGNFKVKSGEEIGLGTIIGTIFKLYCNEITEPVNIKFNYYPIYPNGYRPELFLSLSGHLNGSIIDINYYNDNIFTIVDLSISTLDTDESNIIISDIFLKGESLKYISNEVAPHRNFEWYMTGSSYVDTPKLVVKMDLTNVSINIYFNSGYSRANMYLSIYSTVNLDYFKIFSNNNQVLQSWTRGMDINTNIKVLDLQEILFYSNKTSIFTFDYSKFNSSTGSNIKLGVGVYSLNYADLVDELDFDIVKHNCLINYNDNRYNQSTKNILTLNRNLYNKFTDEEKTQMISCWKTINIRENES